MTLKSIQYMSTSEPMFDTNIGSNESTEQTNRRRRRKKQFLVNSQ